MKTNSADNDLNRNPFKPGAGAAPPVLSGREDLKFEAEMRLKTIAAGDYDPMALQLMGPRGCGKTAMLAWMEKRARDRNIRTVALPKQAFESSEMLALILRRLRRNVFGLGRLNLYLDTNVEAIPGLFSVSAGASGGKDLNGAEVLITESLEALARQQRCLLIIIDEAHDLPTSVAGAWYDAFQLVSRKYPIMLVIAGTPDLKRVIARTGSSFTERFDIWRIGRLNREESIRALIEPFGDQIYFEDDALSAILDQAQGYPYFIQVWGRALWNLIANSSSTSIGLSEVAVATAAAERVRQELYGRRVNEFDSGGMQNAIAEMVFEIERNGDADGLRLGRAASRIVALAGGDVSQVEERLLHTGFLWQPEMGKWDYGIPSLADHIRKLAVKNNMAAIAESGVGTVLAKLLEILPNQKSATEEELLEKLAENGRSEWDVKDALRKLQKIGLLIPEESEQSHLQICAPLLSRRALAELKAMKSTESHHRMTP